MTSSPHAPYALGNTRATMDGTKDHDPAREGIGIIEILNAIVARIPPPEDTSKKPLRALIFDREALYGSAITAMVCLYGRILSFTIFCDPPLITLDYFANEIGDLSPSQLQVEELYAGVIHDLVEDKKGRTVATLFGTWEESLHYVIGGNSGKGKESSYVSSKPHVLWKRSPTPEYQTRYNLTQFAMTLNEITPGLKEKLPPTDSRLRPDQRCLENGQHEMTNFGKLRLEQSQRHERCKRRVGNQGGLPRKKAATLTVILEGTGRPGKRGTGNLVLTFLAKSQPILILTQLHKFSTLLPTYSPYYHTPFDHSIYS
ncbi:hypothetical protein JHK87_010351 [Glycine soja]|nr:hypothetical protein JHK87_010351 [Glycine soja]